VAHAVLLPLLPTADVKAEKRYQEKRAAEKPEAPTYVPFTSRLLNTLHARLTLLPLLLLPTADVEAEALATAADVTTCAERYFLTIQAWLMLLLLLLLLPTADVEAEKRYQEKRAAEKAGAPTYISFHCWTARRTSCPAHAAGAAAAAAACHCRH
jgi:hypothetical protein